MDNNHIIDMEDDIQKFCVSKVTIEVGNYGAKVCIDSWNEHFVRSKLIIIWYLLPVISRLMF